MLHSKKFKRACLSAAVGPAVLLTAHAATITVNTIVDVNGGGPCTLREAVVSLQNVNVGASGCLIQPGTYYGIDDTVIFAEGLRDQTISLTQGHINISANEISVEGLGKTELSILNTNGERHFNVPLGPKLILRDIRLTGNSTGGGIQTGSILPEISTVSLVNTEISGINSGGSGAIYSSGSQIYLHNSSVQGNQIAGIHVEDGSLIIQDSDITQNFGNSGGGIRLVSSEGIIRRSDISGNRAIFSGGGLGLYDSNLTLIDTTVSNNTALSTSGGGIEAQLNSSVTISNSSITGNTAALLGGGVLVQGADESPFGVDISGLTIIRSLISDNHSVNAGGGISLFDARADVDNSTISGNISQTDGGGLRVSRSSLSMINSTISGNDSVSRGGGIAARSSSDLTLRNTIVVDNDSDGPGAEISGSGSTTIFGARNLFGDDRHTTAQALYFVEEFIQNFSIIATSDSLQSTESSKLILPLSNNGGSTHTHSLPASSLAVDSGESAVCFDIDQRGRSRSDGKCDIGALELDQESCFVISTDNNATVVFCL